MYKRIFQSEAAVHDKKYVPEGIPFNVSNTNPSILKKSKYCQINDKVKNQAPLCSSLILQDSLQYPVH